MPGHGDGSGREHSHGGSAHGAGWDLLDAVVFACAIATALLLGEMLIKARRDRVRYDLTPRGLAATTGPVMTDPGCQHSLCTLTHPHAGPAVLTPVEQPTT